MPLQDTDVTLVSRSERNAHATLGQVKDFILDGMGLTTDSLTWTSYPPTEANEISSTDEWEYGSLTTVKINDVSNFTVNNYIVLINSSRGSSGTYQITARNTNSDTLNLRLVAQANSDVIEEGDKFILVNLGSDFSGGTTGTFNRVFIGPYSPTADQFGDLWYQPDTGNLHIWPYDEKWTVITSSGGSETYDMGEYFINAVNDLGLDNTYNLNNDGLIIRQPNHNTAAKIETALRDMFNSGARGGTIYFPAGVYILERKVVCQNVGSNDRVGWVIKGDGVSTKFYTASTNNDTTGVNNETGAFDIRFGNPNGLNAYKDNYITVQDLAIHPKRAINGYGLYLQNGNDQDATNPPDVEPDDNDYVSYPSGGSNQQYGAQIINVHILPDDKKPNSVNEKRYANFFNYPLSLINFGRPRIARTILWNHAERSNASFSNNGWDRLDGNGDLVTGSDGNPLPIRYKCYYNIPVPGKEDEMLDREDLIENNTENDLIYYEYGVASLNYLEPEETGICLNLSNCYSPWVDNCYINGTAKYGIYWNSTRGNTEGGTFTKLVINGADIGFQVSQLKDPDGELDKDNYGRHPHLTVIDSHINSARYGMRMINVKYFHIADILFYARNDRNRDRTLIDCYLTDCHSGVLSNGYSGGAVGNTTKKPPPYDYRLAPEYEDNKDAKNDQNTKSPSRQHVLLDTTYDRNDNGSIVRNRNIVVKDHTLNAYIAKTSPDNRTLGQYDKNGKVVKKGNVKWRAPYEVIGECSGIHIELPDYPHEDHPDGTFDSANYPPDYEMITSDTGPVSFTIAGIKHGFIDEGSEAARTVRQRLELKNKNPQDGDPITVDVYKANVVKEKYNEDEDKFDRVKDLETFATIRTAATNVDADKYTGNYVVNLAKNGVMKNVFTLDNGTAYFPIDDVSPAPMISFSPPGLSTKPGIYYLEGGQPDSTLPNAAAGSLLLKNNGKMYFKTAANQGWREVSLS